MSAFRPIRRFGLLAAATGARVERKLIAEASQAHDHRPQGRR